MPARPLIAVTTSEVRILAGETALTSADPPRREMVLGLTYLRAIADAGGTPVVVPPLEASALDALLDRADGLCLTGGPDLDPAAYGAAPSPRLGPTDRSLDERELALARAADARRLPILGVCRGSQLLNVARGGTLHQHLPDLARPAGTEALVHRQSEPGRQPTHPVAVQPGSRLAGALGAEHLLVNSFHHQAVDRLGRGLVATAWAPDGMIEGYEAPDRPFLVGVQWHTELLTERAPDRGLFAAFVAACAAGERRGRPSMELAG